MPAIRLLCVFALLAIAGIGCGSAGSDVTPHDRPPIDAVDETPVLTEWQWRELEGPLERHVEMVVFSADGSLVAGGSNDTICVWAADTGKLVSRTKLPQTQTYHRLVFSSDGKTLISDCRLDPCTRFWDVKTGKQIREIERMPPEANPPGDRLYVQHKAFAPGGEAVIHDLRGPKEYEYRVVDLTTGKTRASVLESVTMHLPWSEVAFAPDGKTFALNGPNGQVRVFATDGGAMVRDFRPADIGDMATARRSFVRFSPDGKYLIAQEMAGLQDKFDGYRFVIWRVGDGRRMWDERNQCDWLSADNRYLLCDDKTVLDLMTDRAVPIGNAHKNGLRLTGMSADGRTLAFVGTAGGGAPNNTARLSVYLTPAPVLPQPDDFAGREIPEVDLSFTWSGVTSGNQFRRDFAARVLATHPEQAFEHAREKLKPVPAAERVRVADLLTQLDDDDPDVRDRATVDLQKYAHKYEPLFTETFTAAKPGEVRNRLTSIAKLKRESRPPAELLAELRGIAFLEELRTPSARQLLEELSRGAPGNRITDAASASVKRLGSPKP